MKTINLSVKYCEQCPFYTHDDYVEIGGYFCKLLPSIAWNKQHLELSEEITKDNQWNFTTFPKICPLPDAFENQIVQLP